jgi:hypothetical protein
MIDEEGQDGLEDELDSDESSDFPKNDTSVVLQIIFPKNMGRAKVVA